MTYPRFTASIELNRKNWNEFCYTNGSALQRVCFYAGTVGVPLCFLLLRWLMPEFGTLYCWVLLGITLFSHWRAFRAWQRVTDANNGKPLFNKISFRETEIHVVNPDSEREKCHAYGDFQGAWRSRHLLYLALDKKQGLCVDMRTVAGGTPDELVAFLLERCPHWKKRKVPRHFDRRKPAILLASLAVIGILTETGGSFDQSGRSMELREAVDVLDTLEITGITEDTIQELEAFQEDYGLTGSYSPFPDLLWYAGCGEYDPQTWEWTPARNGVYTFDMEAWEVSMMYTNFLKGVSAMSGGALEFTDIVEDDSQVDWESGSGTKTVSFTFRGERYQLEAELIFDWYDVDFLNEISRIVNNSGEEKRLLYLCDGQMVSVFYRDDAWARQFRKLTGFSLDDQIAYY